jgi:DNA-binding transcriptional LysR family regulator
MIASALTSGELTVLDVGAEAEGATIHIAYPRSRGVSAKVRALSDHLRRAIGSPPSWEVGVPQPMAAVTVSRRA